MSKTVEVRLWGTSVGYLGYSPGQKEVATFEYTPQFLNTGVHFFAIVILNGKLLQPMT